MPSSDFSPASGYTHQPAAPYAHPQRSQLSTDGSPATAGLAVGPYIPVAFRGKPAVESAVFTPRSATPPYVPPIQMATAAEDERAAPPSYPTPAYFTPVYSEPQYSEAPEDRVASPLSSLFELPAIVESAPSLPELHESEPAMENSPTLPWIDAFLSTTPAMPMRSIEDPAAVDAQVDAHVDAHAQAEGNAAAHDGLSASLTPANSNDIVADAIAAEYVAPEAAPWPMTEAAPDAPSPSDAWALDEAADQMRALAEDLREHEAARLFDAVAAPEPLPAWSDDDLIDIMPIASADAGARSHERPATPVSSAAHIEPWADRARRRNDDGSEAAARALELLAKRVRDGEISLAGYEPRLGDAAALAAALAALLGVRR